MRWHLGTSKRGKEDLLTSRFLSDKTNNDFIDDWANHILIFMFSLERNFSHFCPSEVVTRLSEVCCQQVVKDGALPVIFKVIKKCNRSLPHLEVIKYSLSILYNVAKVRRRVPAVSCVARARINKIGAKNTPPCVQQFTD